MRKILLLYWLCLTGSVSVQAQKNLWNTPDACLGQTPPGDTPIIFAPGLLAQKDSFDMDRVMFTADGKEFYYQTNTTWFDTKDSRLRCFSYVDGKWMGPAIVQERYYTPSFSADEKTMYLAGGDGDGIHSFVWQAKRKPGGGWAAPIPYLKETYGLYMFMPTRSGVSYVSSNAHQGNMRDFSTYDICTLTIRGGDTAIESLGAPINTAGFDGDFFIAPDESYMIVSTKETKDYECELYISFRRRDKRWSELVSLGPLINDGVAHRWGEYVTPDGKYLFYSRGTSPKDCHIYWVRFDKLLGKLKKKMPYI